METTPSPHQKVTPPHPRGTEYDPEYFVFTTWKPYALAPQGLLDELKNHDERKSWEETALGYIESIGFDKAIKYFSKEEFKNISPGGISIRLLVTFSTLSILYEDTGQNVSHEAQTINEILAEQRLPIAIRKVLSRFLEEKDLPLKTSTYQLEDIFETIDLLISELEEMDAIFVRTQTTIGIEIEFLGENCQIERKNGLLWWAIFCGLRLPYEYQALEISTRYSYGPQTQIALLYLLLKGFYLPPALTNAPTSLHISTEIPSKNRASEEYEALLLSTQSQIARALGFAYSSRQRLEQADFYNGGKETRTIETTKDRSLDQTYEGNSYITESRMTDIDSKSAYVAIRHASELVLSLKIYLMTKYNTEIPPNWNITEYQRQRLVEEFEIFLEKEQKIEKDFDLDNIHTRHEFFIAFGPDGTIPEESFKELQRRMRALIYETTKQIRAILNQPQAIEMDP